MGLDIPVNDIVLMGMLQCTGDLRGKNGHFLGSQLTTAPQILLQRNAVNELHNDVIHVTRAGNVENINNIGMRKHGNGLRLVMELAAELYIRGKLTPQDFHRYITVETMALGLIDHSGAAYANDFQKLIAVVQHCSDIVFHR